MLAHNAANLGLAIDPIHIYDPPDLMFLTWVEMLVDRLRATQAAEDAKAKNG